MTKRLFNKLLTLTFCLSLLAVSSTNSFFLDSENSTGNTFTAGCWAPPSTPVLLSPADDHTAYPGSDWSLNPLMDWSDSVSPCPQSTQIYYEYESYTDSTLHNLAYRSNWLTLSQLPAPGTLQGTYYWRVRAKDNQGNISPFSLPFKLTVSQTPPPAPDPRVLITEVFYDTDSSGQQGAQDNRNDWIELYNAGTAPADLSGWIIDEDHRNSQEILPTGLILKPNHFAVITPDSSTWDQWPVISPDDLKIVLNTNNHKIGNGLSKNDHILLKDQNGNLVDSVSWGTDLEGLNPSVPAVEPGHSLARIDKTIDTDKASDWQDNPNPNPADVPAQLLAQMAPVLSFADTAALTPSPVPTAIPQLDASLVLLPAQNIARLAVSSLLASQLPARFNFIYTSSEVEKAVFAPIATGQTSDGQFTVDIFLGTCSLGVCRPDPDLGNTFQVIITDPSEVQTFLEKTITLP